MRYIRTAYSKGSYLPYPEHILQIRGFLHELELCNALSVVHPSSKHLHQISHDRGRGGREGSVEAVVEEQYIQPAIVQDYRHTTMQQVGKCSIQGVGG